MSGSTRDLDWWRDNGEDVEDHGTYLTTRCPAHGGLSLVVGPGIHKDGHALLDCKGEGCSFEAIRAAIDTPAPRTRRVKKSKKSSAPPTPRAAAPKFPCYSPDGRHVADQLKVGGASKYVWSRKLSDMGVSPQHLHGGLDRLDGLADDELVVVVEGHGPEAALRAAGIPAVSTVTGKGRAGWDHVGAAFLYGRNVVMVPDFGDEEHMDATGSVLEHVVASPLRVVRWPEDCGLAKGEDAAEFIRDNGVGAMRAIIDGAVTWEPREKLRHVRGDEFLFGDDAEELEPIWGDGPLSLWTRGEGLLLAGGVGAGKSTALQQLIFHGIGALNGGTFLGLPVEFPDGVVGYVAADRPMQIRRSMRRMVTPSAANALADRLDVWRGPLPFDLAKADTGVLADFVDARGWDVLAIDSLKDVASNTTDDEAGLAINRQFQELLARGKELIANHHDRKEGHQKRREPKLDDIYGSRWISAGFGSVFYIQGDPGSPDVKGWHLKQPAEVVGPLDMRHDHDAGLTTVSTFTVSRRKRRVPGEGEADTLAHLVKVARPQTTRQVARTLGVARELAGRWLGSLESAQKVARLPKGATGEVEWIAS